MNSQCLPPPQAGVFLDSSRSRHEHGRVPLKTSSWKQSLTSRVMLLANVDVWFSPVWSTNDPLGQAWACIATTIQSRLSLRWSACNRDNGNLAQSSGKPGGDETALGTDCSTNSRIGVMRCDHGRRRMACTMRCADVPNP